MRRFLICIGLCVLCSCAHRGDRHLAYALQEAGENRAELEKVLAHYADDSLKLEAAKFLIRNMVYHTGFYDTLMSVNDEPYIPYDVHPDDGLQVYDSLFRCGYRVQSIKKKDIEVAQADFLIDNIDCAFEAWRKPWARSVSFDNFCRYILPYRSSNEPLCNMRREMCRRYISLLDSACVRNPVDACMFLNTRLKGVYRFVGVLPSQSSVDLVDQCHWSNCEGLAVYIVFLMRSVGIPVSLDCTTWAKSEDGHYWCAVMDEKERWHGFGAAELNCEEHREWFSKKRYLIPPKVYKRVFMPEPIDRSVEDDGYRTYVKNPLYKDVTSTYYVPPVDITLDLPEKLGSEEGYVYLCASAVNHYRVLALGVRSGQRCVVKDVVGDNTFVLADSPDGQHLRFLTDTFYVDSIGRIEAPVKYKMQ